MTLRALQNELARLKEGVPQDDPINDLLNALSPTLGPPCKRDKPVPSNVWPADLTKSRWANVHHALL